MVEWTVEIHGTLFLHQTQWDNASQNRLPKQNSHSSCHLLEFLGRYLMFRYAGGQERKGKSCPSTSQENPRFSIVLRWWKTVSESSSGTSLKCGNGNALDVSLRQVWEVQRVNLPMAQWTPEFGWVPSLQCWDKHWAQKVDDPFWRSLSLHTEITQKEKALFHYSFGSQPKRFAFPSAEIQKAFFILTNNNNKPLLANFKNPGRFEAQIFEQQLILPPPPPPPPQIGSHDKEGFFVFFWGEVIMWEAIVPKRKSPKYPFCLAWTPSCSPMLLD